MKSRCEKAVARAAQQKGFEVFLPVYKARHRWSDRSKLVDELLFPGYVFCQLGLEDRFALLTIPRVMHLVGIGNVPVALADEEILAIRDALRSDAVIQPWPFLDAGRPVRLESGPLAGLAGFLVEANRQHQVVLGLTVLKQSVAVQIEHNWLMPMAQAVTQAAV